MEGSPSEPDGKHNYSPLTSSKTVFLKVLILARLCVIVQGKGNNAFVQQPAAAQRLLLMTFTFPTCLCGCSYFNTGTPHLKKPLVSLLNIPVEAPQLTSKPTVPPTLADSTRKEELQLYQMPV